MQSGKIKHWNADKGDGFIDVDNQDEDVFFHISSVRLSRPISEGQLVILTVSVMTKTNYAQPKSPLTN